MWPELFVVMEESRKHMCIGGQWTSSLSDSEARNSAGTYGDNLKQDLVRSNSQGVILPRKIYIALFVSCLRNGQ
mgnify:CR=1 FL=1